MYRLFVWNFQWILLQLLFVQLNIQYIQTTWPISNSSGIQLLGLFEDNLNISESDLPIVHSRAMFQSAMILSQRYQIMIDNQFIGWQLAYTGGNAIQSLSNTCQSITNSNTVGIIGPSFSREAHVLAAFAKNINIPVISYSATDPTLSDRNAYPTFHRTISSDGTIALTLAQLFLRYNWTSCVIIYQNDAFGTNGADVISDVFNKNSLTVVNTVIFDISTLRIRGNLKDILLNSPTRIIILWAEISHSSTIIQNAMDDDVLGPHFLWILSSTISLNSFNTTSYEKLIGILSIEATSGNNVGAEINSTLLTEAYKIWQEYQPETFPAQNQVHDHGLFTFDATWSFIQSLHQYCSLNANLSSCLSMTNSSFCFNSYLLNSNLFLKTIDQIKFLGISGPISYNQNTTDRTNGTFFLLQNIQPSSNGIDFIPVLKWIASTDWQTYSKTGIILWPNNTLTPPTGFPKLVGVKLRIGVIKSAPFLMEKDIVDASGQKKTQLVGYVIDLIDHLQTLTGFIPEIIVGASNKSYGEMVRGVANGDYDILIGDVTVTSTRREFVDFSTPFYDNTLSIIIRKSSSLELEFFSYLKPFSRQLWLTLLGACLYAALLFWILERKTNDSLKDKSTLSSMAMSIWYSIGTLLGYGADFAAQTAAGRLLTLALYVLCMILVATYTANLTSSLTLLKSKGIISGVDDLKTGKVPLSRIGILVNSAPEEYFIREISDNSRSYYPLTTLDSIYTNLLENKIDASIWDTGIIKYAVNTLYCDLTLVESTFDPSSFAVVIPKGWLYTQTFDIKLLFLRESGVLADLKDKWLEGKTCSDSSSSDQSDAISITSVSGLFATFAAITVLAFLLFLWTKRLIIKKYLSRFIHRKDLITGKENISPEFSVETWDQFKQKSNSVAYF